MNKWTSWSRKEFLRKWSLNWYLKDERNQPCENEEENVPCRLNTSWKDWSIFLIYFFSPPLQLSYCKPPTSFMPDQACPCVVFKGMWQKSIKIIKIENWLKLIYFRQWHKLIYVKFFEWKYGSRETERWFW